MKSKNHRSPAMPGLVFRHQLAGKSFSYGPKMEWIVYETYCFTLKRDFFFYKLTKTIYWDNCLANSQYMQNVLFFFFQRCHCVMCTAVNLWKHFILQEVVKKKKKKARYIFVAIWVFTMGPLDFSKSPFYYADLPKHEDHQESLPAYWCQQHRHSAAPRAKAGSGDILPEDEGWGLWDVSGKVREGVVTLPPGPGSRIHDSGIPPSIALSLASFWTLLPHSWDREFSKAGPSPSYSLRRERWAPPSSLGICIGYCCSAPAAIPSCLVPPSSVFPIHREFYSRPGAKRRRGHCWNSLIFWLPLWSLPSHIMAQTSFSLEDVFAGGSRLWQRIGTNTR